MVNPLGAMFDSRHCLSAPADPSFATPGVINAPPGALHFAPPSFYSPCGAGRANKGDSFAMKAMKHVFLYNIPHTSHDLIASTRDALVILILCFPVIFR